MLAGRGIDSHLAISQSNGQIQYGLADAINSTIATVDQDGAVQSRFQYEPFGQTSAAGTYPFQFAGRQPISSATYYNRARFYNSQTGNFISEDPIGFVGGSNLYSYVHNSPDQLCRPAWSFNTEEVLKGLGGIAGGLDQIGIGIVLAPTAETVVGGLASAALISTGVVGTGWGLAQVVGGAFDQDVPGSTRKLLFRR